MSGGGGYAFDLGSPVSHVAASLDRAAPAALSLGEMAADYRHVIHSDLERIQINEGCASDTEATRWLISRAIDELRYQGKTSRSKAQLIEEGGLFRLAVPLGDLLWDGGKRKVWAQDATGAKDEENAIRRVYNDLNADRSFWVTVAGAKGGMREQQFRLHPLARSIPATGFKEFADLAADVKARGVKMPVVIYDGQVLDGRHRVALASALKLPVRVDEFTGTEDEARDHVISLNVQRRHLSVAQRALIVYELYMPQAEAEARERELAGTTNRTNTVAPSGATVAESAKAVEIAAARSNGLANVRTLERMRPVMGAPQTRELVRSGKIKEAAAARREAIKETGSNEPAEPPALQPRSAFNALGDCLGGARRFCEAMESGERGTIGDEKFLGRLDEIAEFLERGRKAMESNRPTIEF